MSRNYFLPLISLFFFIQPLVHGQVINITTEEDFDKLLNDNDITVVKFYTTWCGGCKAVENVFEELSQDSATEDVAFAQIDIEAIPTLKEQYDISHIPQFLFFRNKAFVKKQPLKALGALKQDMLDIIAQLQNPQEYLDEHDIAPEMPQQELPQEKGYLAHFIELLMVPITFVINLVHKIVNTIMGWFS